MRRLHRAYFASAAFPFGQRPTCVTSIRSGHSADGSLNSGTRLRIGTEVLGGTWDALASGRAEEAGQQTNEGSGGTGVLDVADGVGFHPGFGNVITFRAGGELVLFDSGNPMGEAYPDVVAGAKDSSGDWSNTKAYLDNFAAQGFDVFPGSETFLLQGLRNGGAGCISATANVNPGAIARLNANWESADADSQQLKLNEVRGIFARYPMKPPAAAPSPG